MAFLHFRTLHIEGAKHRKTDDEGTQKPDPKESFAHGGAELSAMIALTMTIAPAARFDDLAEWVVVFPRLIISLASP